MSKLYHYKCVIVRVVDGDTVIANIDLGLHVTVKRSVRLLDYNAPEIGGHARTVEERVSGRAAKAKLESIAAGDFIIETQLDRADKYGRVLGRFWSQHVDDVVAGISLNDLMIQWLANESKPTEPKP